MKILIVRNDNIGDLIITTPIFEAIKKKYPDSFVGALCAGYSKDAFEGNPYIDKLYVYEKAKHHKGLANKLKAWIMHFKAMLDIRKEQYDVAVGVRASFSRSNADLVAFSGAKTKIIRKPNNKKEPYGFDYYIDTDVNNTHEVECAFECLAPINVLNGGEKPFFYIPQDVQNMVKNNLLSIGFDEYVIFHVTARIEPDKWHINKFLELATLINKELGKKVLITAGLNTDEAKIAANFCADKTGIKFLKTDTLKELAAAIKFAKLYITVNGGAMHLGAAVGTDMVALLGDFIIQRWKPYGCNSVCVQPPSFFCNDISVAEAFKAVETQIIEQQSRNKVIS